MSETPKRLYQDGDRVINTRYKKHSDTRGTIHSGRWEYGNQQWGYSVQYDQGGATMALENWLQPIAALIQLAEQAEDK